MLTGKHATAVNGAATVTIPASSTYRPRIYELIWSYSAAPTNGQVSSTGVEGDQLAFLITAGGPGAVPLAPVYGRLSTEVTFTLAAGGAGITGTLDVIYKPNQ